MGLELTEQLAKELYGYITFGWEIPDPDELTKLIKDFLFKHKVIRCKPPEITT